MKIALLAEPKIKIVLPPGPKIKIALPPEPKMKIALSPEPKMEKLPQSQKTVKIVLPPDNEDGSNVL